MPLVEQARSDVGLALTRVPKPQRNRMRFVFAALLVEAAAADRYLA
jgi:hypothetical protein